MNNSISLGNLYDLNKNLVLKNNLPMSEKVLQEKKEELIKFFSNNIAYYYMLLCNEERDYTILDLIAQEQSSYINCANAVIDCLINRGEVLLIDRQDNNAYECWVKKGNSVYMYALFPYDDAVILC